MLNRNKDICELVRTLLGSTCTHVAYGIRNEKNRFAYVRAMSRCYYLCSERESGNDIHRMRLLLEKLRMSAPKTFTPRFELLASTKGYYMMGVHHSIDIVESILIRFEKGYSHNDEFFVRNILRDRKDER